MTKIPDDFLPTFSVRFKVAMREKGPGTAIMNERLGKPGYAQGLMQGKFPTLDEFILICNILGVTPNWMLGYEDTPVVDTDKERK